MAKHTILIVDDSEASIERVRRPLADSGYGVNGATTSHGAIESARSSKIDLLIINPTMPVLSGVEAAKQIAQIAKCKVLFLTGLARDPDFREMLRGLRQQGCDCSAISAPFEGAELLADVRREIGDNTPIADQSAQVGQAPSGNAATPARAPIAQYELFLAMVGPQTYESNAFRVTDLSVDASLRDISRKAERLEMMAKLNGNAVTSGPFFATAPSADAVRGALQCLKNPEQRLLHEFFWFWPTGVASQQDPALVAIKTGDVSKAENIWKAYGVDQSELRNISAQLDFPRSDIDRQSLLTQKNQLIRAAAVSIHNLAIISHIRALSLAAGRSTNSKSDRIDRAEAWKASFGYWSKLWNQHSFWEVLSDRIRTINDPRIGAPFAEMIWNSLPLALLSLNAQFAVTAAEAHDFAEASLHEQAIKESGFGNAIRDALLRKLKPLQDELVRLCRAAEEESLAEPERAIEVVRRLFEDKKKYLQTFNYLLGAGDTFRDTAHDLVAQTARTCLVAYANKTENWEAANPLFEECLALSESKSLRSKLEDDLEMLRGNIAGQRRETRQAESVPSPAASAPNPRQSGAAGIITGIFFAVIVICVIINSIMDKSSNQPGTQSAPAVASENSTLSGSSTEAETLKKSIENDRVLLAQLNNDLSTFNAELERMKPELDSDLAYLKQAQRDHEMGLDVDRELYETTRARRSASVKSYNRLIGQYDDSLAAHKALLKSINDRIDRYNALVRSR